MQQAHTCSYPYEVSRAPVLASTASPFGVSCERALPLSPTDMRFFSKVRGPAPAVSAGGGGGLIIPLSLLSAGKGSLPSREGRDRPGSLEPKENCCSPFGQKGGPTDTMDAGDGVCHRVEGSCLQPMLPTFAARSVVFCSCKVGWKRAGRGD